MELILASQSPRRRELLERMGLSDFKILSPDIDERAFDGLPPEALVRIVCHNALAGRPFILETPNDDAGYAAEIAWLREQWEARHA